jgi:eukaryotic-like serine/threonine-protein kinase
VERERWRQIEELCLAALEQEESKRHLFVAEACGQDDELRIEVESLLASEYEARSEGFIESPALEIAAKLLEEDLSRRDNLNELDFSAFSRDGSRYRILEKLGTGGMGTVYKAEDVILKRLVALKFLFPLSPDFSAGNIILPGVQYDRSTLERVISEARASSALDHPNICTVHEVGQYEGHPFIVMQFLTGRTLKDEINGKPLSSARIIDLGVQIASALKAAHTTGIIHRDIKSANIFVTEYGEAKILDFGLAKLTSPGVIDEVPTSPSAVDGPDTRLSESNHNQAGRFLGTTFYMSPEQLRGLEVDARTDLFSFGVVLYEMATGQLPFKGDTAVAISDRILQETPASPANLNPELPAELARIINLATKKDRGLRYQTAAALRDDLIRLKEDSTEQTIQGSQGHKRWTLTLAALTVLLGTALLMGYFHLRSRRLPPPADPEMLVLADFNNSTSEAVFDGTLKQALRAQLEQSPFLNVLPDQKARKELSFMGRTPDTRLTGDVAREVCLRTGSKVFVDGAISEVGNHYVVLLQAVNCQTGEATGTQEAEAESREGVLRSLGEAATKLRSRLGESLATIRKYNAPAEATTASLDALQAYSFAIAAKYTEGDKRAVPLFQRAIDLDSHFAMAYAQMGVSYLNLNQPPLAAAAITKAYELRQQVSEREKLYIESHYYYNVTGEADKAIDVNKLWQDTYPRDFVPYVNLGTIFSALGQHEKALAEEIDALSIGGNNVWSYFTLVNSYMNVNQFDKASEVLSEAKARKMENAYFPGIRYQLAFARNDEAEMERQVAAASVEQGTEGWISALQSDTAAYHGRLSNARELTRRAVAAARHDGDEETALSYLAVGALREAEIGNRQLAKKQASATITHDLREQVSILEALALARAGEEKKALALALNLNQRFPKETLLNEYWLPTIRAAVELNRGADSQAIEDLEPTRPYELAVPPLPSNVLLYPVYLRGEAYLAMGLPAKAQAEFKKILDHRGLAGNDLLGALAHLGIGRAYAMEAGIPVVPGSVKSDPEHIGGPIPTRADAVTKARSAYQDFFTIWKAADPDIPLLVQARMEYSKVK